MLVFYLRNSTLFYMHEQNMTVSFCEYLERFEKAADSREVTVEKLQRYLDELDAALKEDGSLTND